MLAAAPEEELPDGPQAATRIVAATARAEATTTPGLKLAAIKLDTKSPPMHPFPEADFSMGQRRWNNQFA
jgi:hypothetical protein